MPLPTYSWWYAVDEVHHREADPEEIHQGDILQGCRVVDVKPPLYGSEPADVKVSFVERNLIVMTQSCDLARGRTKTEQVVLCQVWRRSEVAHIPPFNKSGALGQVRNGHNYAFHVLAACDIRGFESELMIVSFREVFTLPLDYVRQFVRQPHIRLLPPYREQLSQAFARFFMRVGLPLDIPDEQLR